MFKQMSGKRKSVKIPALFGEPAVSDKEKAHVLDLLQYIVVSTWMTHRQQKDRVVRENGNVREKRGDDMSALDVEFTMSELKIALQGTGYTAPG